MTTMDAFRQIAEELRVNRQILNDLVLIRLLSLEVKEPEEVRNLRAIDAAIPRSPSGRPRRPAILDALDKIAKR